VSQKKLKGVLDANNQARFAQLLASGANVRACFGVGTNDGG
jgi:hypothetical protein